MESVTILHGPPSGPSGPHAKVLCPMVFWLVLFLHHDLVPRPSCRGHLIFLDKVCIHQTDTKLQKEGIAHLAMFLLFSGQLVVLEDDDYLERLWTVYELATFLTLQPDGRVVILPVNLPMGVVVSSLVLTMSVVLNWSLRTNVVNEVLAVSAPTMWVFRRCARYLHTPLSGPEALGHGITCNTISAFEVPGVPTKTTVHLSWPTSRPCSRILLVSKMARMPRTSLTLWSARSYEEISWALWCSLRVCLGCWCGIRGQWLR